MTSQRDTFDPANVPRPENMGQRRGYIDQYIQRFHSDLVPRIEEKRKASYPIVCKHYHEQRGQIEVEQELGTWIWSDDADLVEREIRLAIVREIWLYGSSKPEVIRRAFNWLTYFSTNLDPSI
ncbi:hypothetical protein RAB80_012640 [Fusarium oxysporum f. sp. vasinfectum]|uniref:Uncharacterized protein n=1 Tax=Fusarium oxysporum f. sp. vasinfectum 25433 TaxID=1089449 RepID=X0LK17_FUSOX|nr:hypothetical protein FOTG_07265 [Fusarium oxysporum f. sp. vasinfectum 25433]KAK2672561.1 hypothetical protein RAB80_012640 [Fusarium oxysporum f. sp. vasinfectum]KAK2928174.1 hypothetical protein FoTM2_011036 [Fusarium oxysporum f. sp. vasinfectum]